MVGYNRNNLFVKNILDRIIQGNGTIKIDSKKANQFSKVREIRYLRKKDKIIIAKDHRKDISIIHCDGINLYKKDNKYFFDGL